MAVYGDQRLGQAVQQFLTGGLGQPDPQAVGRASLDKARTDRQNQETLAREMLGNAIMSSGETGMGPRDMMRNIYGRGVQISDAFAGNAPVFARGAGLGVYGTDQLGTRMAADLMMGAGDPFSQTELGFTRAEAGKNARAAAAREAEANAPMVLGNNEMMVVPDGNGGYAVPVQNRDMQTADPDQMVIGTLPDGNLGAVVEPNADYVAADINATNAGAANNQASADRTNADIAAGAPAADVRATNAGATNDLALGDRALAETARIEADLAAGAPAADVRATNAGAANNQASADRTNADIAAGAPAADVRATNAGATNDLALGDRALAEAARIEADLAAGAPAADVDYTRAQTANAGNTAAGSDGNPTPAITQSAMNRIDRMIRNSGYEGAEASQVSAAIVQAFQTGQYATLDQAAADILPNVRREEVEVPDPNNPAGTMLGRLFNTAPEGYDTMTEEQVVIPPRLGEAAAPPPDGAGGVATPQSEAEYNALPSGTQYIHPQTGTVKVKP